MDYPTRNTSVAQPAGLIRSIRCPTGTSPVQIPEERRADDQGFFMLKQWHSTFYFTAPALRC